MSFTRLFRACAGSLLSLALSCTIAVAQGNGHGHDRYADHDQDIRGWYRAHHDHLPPGLAKRDHLPPGLERQLVVNGSLPPGLQKKMQPCPRELEVMLPPPPPNYVHVVIGGNLVMYNRATLQIGDVLHLDATF